MGTPNQGISLCSHGLLTIVALIQQLNRPLQSRVPAMPRRLRVAATIYLLGQFFEVAEIC